jgi:16S rRNA (adenine1518-N6/adenine1519-N6)-dimethyltransferase
MKQSSSSKPILGQHWLTDNGWLERIVHFSQITSADTVLEIGPGLGTLSAHLLKTAERVVALELDQHLYDNLRTSFAGSALDLRQGDILEFDLRILPPDYHVVANIPYYITAPILKKLTTATNPPASITLLVQKEVAQRVAAPVGQLSLLALSVQNQYRPELGEVVAADRFTPPPKVDSQLLRLVRRSSPQINLDAAVRRLIKTAFANRRKTLINSLSSLPKVTKPMVEATLQATGLAATVRPQELSLQQWRAVTDHITVQEKSDLNPI